MHSKVFWVSFSTILRRFLSCSEMGSILACVCYIHCFFIIVRLRNFFPLSLYLSSLPRCCYSLLGIFPSIVVLWGTIVDKWLPIKIVFCCPHLLPVINENEAIYCTKTKLRSTVGENKKNETFLKIFSSTVIFFTIKSKYKMWPRVSKTLITLIKSIGFLKVFILDFCSFRREKWIDFFATSIFHFPYNLRFTLLFFWWMNSTVNKSRDQSIWKYALKKYTNFYDKVQRNAMKKVVKL